MGKMRKLKRNKAKRNAILPTKNPEEEIPCDNKESAIQTILDQLQAPDVEEKYCGLQSMALLIDSPENVDQAIEQGLVKIAAPLLLDAASSVRNAAAGMLRNLSTVKMEVCDAMMDQDVMTPLACYFHEHVESWTKNKKSHSYQEDTDTIVQCLHLLLNLCETSELAVKYLNQTRILDILPRFIVYDEESNNDILIAILQCLYVVVEDNPDAIEKIKSNGAENALVVLILIDSDTGKDPPPTLLVKTLAAGIIINLCGSSIAALPVNIMHMVIIRLANTLEVDHRLVCSQLSSNIPLVNEAGNVPEVKGEDAKDLEKQLKSVTELLEAQLCAVEILANICFCEGDGDNDDMENDEMDDDNLQEYEQAVLAADKLPTHIMEPLISLEVFEKVWARTLLPAQNVLLILKEYDGSQNIVKRLHSLQSRALLCMNNMIPTLPIDKLGGVLGVYQIWVEVGMLVFKQDAEKVTDLESATAVMREALEKIKIESQNRMTSACIRFSEIALSDIEMMLTAIGECKEPETRANLIRMTGILALILVKNLNDSTTTIICTITDFILEQAHKENSVWVMAEAIDSIVDIYSEDETDECAVKVKLIDKLQILSPILKNKARQQKKLPREYKVLVSTAVSNLPRFIAYKRKRINNLCKSY